MTKVDKKACWKIAADFCIDSIQMELPTTIQQSIFSILLTKTQILLYGHHFPLVKSLLRVSKFIKACADPILPEILQIQFGLTNGELRFYRKGLDVINTVNGLERVRVISIDCSKDEICKPILLSADITTKYVSIILY
jgi:hypothetical protein